MTYQESIEPFEYTVSSPGLRKQYNEVRKAIQCSDGHRWGELNNVKSTFLDTHHINSYFSCLSSQDGLFLVTNSLDLISGYPLAVLTPNVNEYKRLVQKVLQSEVNDRYGTQQLLSLAKG